MAINNLNSPDATNYPRVILALALSGLAELVFCLL